MPVLKVRPVRRGARALIVGNGPSTRALAWQAVWRWIALNRGSWADLFLMNRTALGPTVPRYAVAIGPEVIEDFARARLYERAQVLTAPPWKQVGPDVEATTYGGILTAQSTLFAPDDWPNHASGPLATWAASALGYEEIWLFGLDGTAGAPQDAPDWDHRARVWEHWTGRWREARTWVEGQPHGPGNAVEGQRLVRVWPRGAAPAVDPLGEAVTETVVI